MSETKPLTDRAALVTGGSRGIGRAIARKLATLGAEVGVVGRDSAELSDTRDLVEAQGRKCLVIEADIATTEGARRAGRAALDHRPHWDILVNNAGVAISKPLLEMTDDELDEILSVNLRATLVISQSVVPPMLERRSGKVINISSVGAFLGTPGLGGYAASKAALNQLTRTMAVEWGPYNVQVNSVCPTVVLTDMGHKVWDDPARSQERSDKEARIPAHRFGEPEDVADLVAFLAGPASGFINGVAIPLDGGLLASP